MLDENGPGQETAEARSGLGQSMIGGLALIAFAIFALYAMRDLDGGGSRALGPGGLPRMVAWLIAALGLVIAVRGWRESSAARAARIKARPLVIVLLAIAVFAGAIRPWSLGALSIPGLGLVVAGPLTVFVAGFAEPRRDWLDLSILACALTAFCMILFGDLLALPIPVMPNALLDWFPGWPQRAVLRLLAGLLAGAALLLRGVSRRGGGKA